MYIYIYKHTLIGIPTCFDIAVCSLFNQETVDTSFLRTFALTKTNNFLIVWAVSSMTDVVSDPVRLLSTKRLDTSSLTLSIVGIGRLSMIAIRSRHGRSNPLLMMHSLLSSCFKTDLGCSGFPPSKRRALISSSWSHTLDIPEMKQPSEGCNSALSSKAVFFGRSHCLSYKWAKGRKLIMRI